MTELAAQLQMAYEELEPQFKALRASMSALKTAGRLASEEKPDALPMQKALVKLQAAAADVDSDTLDTAVAAFAAETQAALDNLAYDFAKDLRAAFAARGEDVTGRPPTLAIGDLSFCRTDFGVTKSQVRQRGDCSRCAAAPSYASNRTTTDVSGASKSACQLAPGRSVRRGRFRSIADQHHALVTGLRRW